MLGFPADWTIDDIITELDHQLTEAKDRSDFPRIIDVEYKIARAEQKRAEILAMEG